MESIISLLLAHIQVLNNQIYYLLIFIAKNIPLRSKDNSLFSPKYSKLTIDKLPVIKTFEKKDYKQILKTYLEENGKPLKPVKSRGANPVPKDVVCPCCSAPHEFLYDNTGGRGQISCKLCKTNFSKDKTDFKPATLTCPYCGHALVQKKERKIFNVHKCVNDNCTFYQNSLKSLSSESLEEYKQYPHRFKLRYIYREFVINFFKMDLLSLPKNAVNLKFRKFSSHIMGLVLTYRINCGLSNRATATAMQEIHNINISFTQVNNYTNTVAAIIKPFVDLFDYKPSRHLAGDETYGKIKGLRHYTWLVMDAIKKSILGYRVSFTRDTGSCILALRMAFSKFKEFPGKALKFIADGYSSYPLACQQFKLNNMDFDVTQVIGLTNDDPVSTEFRWVKQVIERLNRTFKFAYKPTNGYGSEEGANAHLVLFVAYYNFLRPHPYTYKQPLNHVPELANCPNMPAKWQMLVKLSQQLILSNQCS
jgi:transposase-like protein